MANEFKVRRSLRFEGLSSPPVDPETGDIYKDTAGVLYRWDGSAWVAIGTSAWPTFPLANNQSSPADVTGFEFDDAQSRIYKAEYAITRKYAVTDPMHLDAAFTANASSSSKFGNTIYAIVKQLDGKILIGGNFTNYGGVSGRDRLVRLNADGTVDTAFCANASDGSKFTTGPIRTILIDSNDKIWIGGAFNYVNAPYSRSNLTRLNADGTPDSSLSVAALNEAVMSVTMDIFDNVYVAGQFTSYNLMFGRDRLIRFNAAGTLDSAFCVNATDSSKFAWIINKLTHLPDGSILVGGGFANYGGTSGRNYLVKLNSDGTLNTSFTTNAADGAKFNGVVSDIAVDSYNTTWVSGGYTVYAGTAGRNYLVPLDSSGSVEAAKCAAIVDGKINNQLRTVTTDSNGKIWIGGDFTAWNSTTYNRALVINADGLSVDTDLSAAAIDLSSGAVWAINAEDDEFYLGGTFTNYDAPGNDRFIKLVWDNASAEYLTLGSFVALFKSGSWTAVGEIESGDAPETSITLNSSGQVQYTTSNLSGTEVASYIAYKIFKA